ncbi:hypothetical protein PPL_04832 [Heterostelium album PN500]|uniref:Uncharacterized protein n=1 Tax=Heterostelium pallidum (strain ATCC 26659 / Pp 5 / PN500) TaxID=670386 RepID=D3B8N9_HETP5|nr:hypothetical protein PPL_04832 [Heterostelium album PN500]EFA82407.1 hypothetical protein PPL_04832 [Heterostelium album PN500]|eukprot:XP_020434524.1 hypothetical protein PPL_04832 [Heterostelium album PN500]
MSDVKKRKTTTVKKTEQKQQQQTTSATNKKKDKDNAKLVAQQQENVEVVEKKKKIVNNKQKVEDDDVATTSSSSNDVTTTSSTEGKEIKYGAKKYTQKQLDQIRKENMKVFLKFIIFTILMFLVPFGLYFWWMESGADYFEVIRRERTTYGGIIAISGMAVVMASYTIMAYYEK